ncbi:MAG: FIST N-terminal domain-containing protein [Amaricoccus sp.]|uniref:FIST N-terminal domain-containing protein n=1 Tax=Amaricoccus sp. TaxID=1872485 RepID=UPI0039E37B0E
MVSAHAPAGEPRRALFELRTLLGAEPCALVVVFASPLADRAAVAQAGAEIFPGTPVVGCTTAGEIASSGYAEQEIVAVGFRASHFRAQVAIIPDLAALDPEAAATQAVRLRAELGPDEPAWRWEFGFLLIDGLSRREDQLVAALRLGLGTIPLFGGSAGDGLDFGRTFVLADGVFRSDTAVLVLLRSRCRIEVFKFDNLEPVPIKMIVTDAEPERRVVRELNAAPAAQEYARLIGRDPAHLSPFTFASHPVVVRIGDQHHVRAIQKVEPNGDLVFFSAIDEGLVLTLAEPMPIARHLERALDALDRRGRPEAILACDCILRRLAVEQVQGMREVSRILSEHHVVGFSTYGEQFNSVHVNQTMTGVAIYPADEDAT